VAVKRVRKEFGREVAFFVVAGRLMRNLLGIRFNAGGHMKRDMDLVRKILLDATSQDDGYAGSNPEIEGYTEDQIAHHIYLMEQAGLVEAADTSTKGSSSPTAILTSITWKGHDFIDVARSNTVWGQAQEKAKSVGGSLTFDLMKELVVAVARSQIGLP
jgi:hypothetical protein